jgi:hypothetical protein
MDVNKSSESVITITVSVSVELRTLLEEGTQPFAVQCRAALEEELAPILGIGQRAPQVPADARRAAEPPNASNLTPPVMLADEATTEVAGPAERNEIAALPSPDESAEAQIPPSQRRGGGRR